jgi:uncharacterized damage-inducible protein DinB
MSSHSLLISLIKYKVWADSELHAAVASLGPSADADETHAAIRLLNHIHVVDKIFAANLQGAMHGFTDTNTPDTPSIDDLSWAVQETDNWYLSYVSDINPASLEETLQFTFVDGDKGQMNREEMLMHVITHGAYHRGAVGRILTKQSVAAPRDLFTKFLHATEPQRRAS